VSFWATWCSPCKKELNNINEIYDEWKTKYNLELVAVCTDNARNVSKVKPYVDGQGWDYEIVMDVNQDLQRLMNIVQIPHTFLIDQNGHIVYQHSGYVEGDEFMLEEKIKALTGKK
jgi:thiol-disulfide isomerase/thioredoxin